MPMNSAARAEARPGREIRLASKLAPSSFRRASCVAGIAWLGVWAPATPALGGTYYSTQPSGEWSSPATWGGSGVPGANDTAIITPGHAVNITAADVLVGSLEVRVGTVLRITPGRTLSVGEVSTGTSETAADLNGDGRVNGADLANLLAQWSGASIYVPCPPMRPADLNRDCRADGLDLAMLLGAWG